MFSILSKNIKWMNENILFKKYVSYNSKIQSGHSIIKIVMIFNH